MYAYKHYEIILSDSSEQAEGFLSDIKTELEENAALREDFGELEGRVWKASVILLSNGVKIEALGAGKKIRGRRHKQWRPDLILCDDLENDENVNTPEQRKKLRDWFYKAVSKAGDTYTDIVYIGTLLHYDALLANVAKNPEYEACLLYTSSPAAGGDGGVHAGPHRAAEGRAAAPGRAACVLRGERYADEEETPHTAREGREGEDEEGAPSGRSPSAGQAAPQPEEVRPGNLGRVGGVCLLYTSCIN